MSSSLKSKGECHRNELGGISVLKIFTLILTTRFCLSLKIHIKLCLLVLRNFSKFLLDCPSVQFSSIAQSFLTLCNPMNHSTPGLPVHHQLPEFTQTQVHRVSDAIQPSYPLSSPSPPAPNPSQHQGLFQWVNSLHEVAKVLEFQLIEDKKWQGQWRTGKPSVLQSMGLHRVVHDWATRKQQPIKKKIISPHTGPGVVS